MRQEHTRLTGMLFSVLGACGSSGGGAGAGVDSAGTCVAHLEASMAV
jgi:hypothetical protein